MRIKSTRGAIDLSVAEVIELRRMHAEDGYGYKRLARHFGVNEQVARNIVKKRYRNNDPATMTPWAETSNKFGRGPTPLDDVVEEDWIDWTASDTPLKSSEATHG